MEVTVLNIERLIIFFLFIIALVTWIGNQLPTPYTVGLVLAGLALTLIPNFDFEVSELVSELILALFLPPIVFQAAYQMDTRNLRSNFLLLAMLTTVGVLISTVVVAAIIPAFDSTIALITAAIFGALISAIDPVAVIAVFKELHVSKRLETLIEGESLLNDGTAIVIFSIVLAAAQAGSMDVWQGLLDFLRVSLGGLVVGGLIGLIVARSLYHIDDYLVEMTLTTCLAFGAYLIAEQIHVSGVLAVVMAGLIHGRMGFSNMGERTQEMVLIVWEYMAEVANSIIFLLIGLTSDINDLIQHMPLIALSIVAVLASRVFLVYVLAPFQVRFITKSQRLPVAWRHVLFWGGQRGAVSLALALSLPHFLVQRELIIIMTFGVVLFTSLVQATTMPMLINRLDLVQLEKESLEAAYPPHTT